MGKIAVSVRCVEAGVENALIPRTDIIVVAFRRVRTGDIALVRNIIAVAIRQFTFIRHTVTVAVLAGTTVKVTFIGVPISVTVGAVSTVKVA